VGKRLNRRQVTMVEMVLAIDLGIGVLDRVQDQGEYTAVPRRHVGRRAVNKAVPEDQGGPGAASRGDERTGFGNLPDLALFNNPEGKAGRDRVMPGRNAAELVRAREKIERAVELGHIVKKDVQVER